MTFPNDDAGARRAQMAARARDAAGEKLGQIGGPSCCGAFSRRCSAWSRCSGRPQVLDFSCAWLASFSRRRSDRARRSVARRRPTLGVDPRRHQLGTGAALLFLPGTSARAAFTILGVWALVTGLGYLWGARQMDAQESERSAALTLGGVISLGGLVLILWPGTGLVALAWAVAVVALVVAALLIGGALRMKRVGDRLGQPGPTRTRWASFPLVQQVLRRRARQRSIEPGTRSGLIGGACDRRRAARKG